MGLLNHLIEPGKEPTPGTEYIYMLDMIWQDGTLGSYSLDQDTVVTDVVKFGNCGYEFTVPGRPGRWCSNYSWAFAENTPENRERLAEYRRIEKISKDWDAIREEAFKNIQKL